MTVRILRGLRSIDVSNFEKFDHMTTSRVAKILPNDRRPSSAKDERMLNFFPHEDQWTTIAVSAAAVSPLTTHINPEELSDRRLWQGSIRMLPDKSQLVWTVIHNSVFWTIEISRVPRGKCVSGFSVVQRLFGDWWRFNDRRCSAMK